MAASLVTEQRKRFMVYKGTATGTVPSAYSQKSNELKLGYVPPELAVVGVHDESAGLASRFWLLSCR